MAHAEQLAREGSPEQLWRSIGLFHEVAHDFDALGYRAATGVAMLELGRVYRRIAWPDSAGKYVARALDLFRMEGRRYQEGAALLLKARLLADKARPDASLPLLDEAIPLLGTNGPGRMWRHAIRMRDSLRALN